MKRGLAASLIVRNEAHTLAPCLASLNGLVDEIHVHDTGSTDGTPELAVKLGAIVTHGLWRDDFAAARNEALSSWSSDWVLCIDADEQVVAVAPALRNLLNQSTADALLVNIDNVEETGSTPTGLRDYFVLPWSAGRGRFMSRWSVAIGHCEPRLCPET